MNCPKCGKNLDEVIVVSKCFQTVEIDKDGNINDETYNDPIVEETLSIECLYCLADITSVIKE